MTTTEIPIGGSAFPLTDHRSTAAGPHAVSSHSPSTPSPDGQHARTVWGLDPLQLHNRYWAAHGVQVVAQGEPSEIIPHAELYLLVDPGTYALFKLTPLMETLNWIKPQVLFVRLHDSRERGYRENVILDAADRFVRFQRIYDTGSRLTRVALTPNREIAALWQSSADPIKGWRRLRKFIARHDRATCSTNGAVYDRGRLREVAYFVQDLVQLWKRPDSTVARARKATGEVWRDFRAKIDPTAKFIGPVWVGAGRVVEAGRTVIGPAVIWDDPMSRPASESIEWQNIFPTEPAGQDPDLHARPSGFLGRAAKRIFDLAFSIVAIVLTMPLYPFIILAIWLEDGRPFFFAHTRESRGGREFPCVKFRSMRKDAEQMKHLLKGKNQADGPQFFIEDDPRLTRTGRLLRKFNFDELPQFFNVLAGHMSIVGPRPSPRRENQYCPPWREARLSVRPGITGLWQVKRTRKSGTDFQEWIKYDIEYVERHSFWFDLYIIYGTIATILAKVTARSK